MKEDKVYDGSFAENEQQEQAVWETDEELCQSFDIEESDFDGCDSVEEDNEELDFEENCEAWDTVEDWQDFEEDDSEDSETSSYQSFAWVYDTFMDNIPYDDWTAYLTDLLREYGVADGLVLDMGCGTGNVTERLAAAGYDMIGIDNSEEMLMEAREKGMENQSSSLYLLQDMRSFELYGTVAAAVSICDSMNYILEENDLEQVFRLVNNYLDPGGVFIFDFNTPYKYKEVIGDQVIAENREDCSFIWENNFDEEQQINIYDLTIFIQEQKDLFRRYQETHYQKAWTVEAFRQAAERAGMKVLKIYDAFTREEPKADSERLYMIVQECGK